MTTSAQGTLGPPRDTRAGAGAALVITISVYSLRAFRELHGGIEPSPSMPFVAMFAYDEAQPAIPVGIASARDCCTFLDSLDYDEGMFFLAPDETYLLPILRGETGVH